MHGQWMNGGSTYPACRCCGEAANSFIRSHPETFRCGKHLRRNPCAISGCSRTCKANGHLHEGDWWVCGVHWKVVCPPGSRDRRICNTFFRRARKLGIGKNEPWPDELNRLYWKHFARVVARGRKMFEPDIDVKAIHELFGWDVPE